jgi:hypothetical protein
VDQRLWLIVFPAVSDMEVIHLYNILEVPEEDGRYAVVLQAGCPGFDSARENSFSITPTN